MGQNAPDGRRPAGTARNEIIFIGLPQHDARLCAPEPTIRCRKIQNVISLLARSAFGRRSFGGVPDCIRSP